MSHAARALDGVAVALAGLVAAVLALGSIRLGPVVLERPEDLVVVAAAVLAVRLVLAPARSPRLPPAGVVVTAVGLYVVLMGIVVVTRHVALRTHALDLGYYVQLVWSLGQGLGARVTLPPMHAWGDHFSPVLYLFAPLGRWAPGAVPLLVAQTVIFAAGALAVHAHASRRTGHAPAAAALAGLYLMNPTLHGINIRDVHPAAFAIPLVLAAALAFDAGRPAWCAVALALALAGREDAAVAGVGFGVWLALARHRWALGASVAGVCVALLWIDVAVLMPHFRGETYPHLVKRYAYLGESLPEVLVTAVARPWRWTAVVFSLDKLVYVLALLAPLGFLPLLAPRALAAAGPGLAMNLLSTDPILFHHRTQYQAFVLPFLVLAAVDGLTAWRRWTASRARPRRRWTAPAIPLVAAGLIALALGARTVNDLGAGKWRLTPEQHALHGLVARVPAAVPASVNERVVPHLAARAEIYVYPTAAERSTWILERDTELAATPPPPAFDVAARAAGWTLLRRAR